MAATNPPSAAVMGPPSVKTAASVQPAAAAGGVKRTARQAFEGECVLSIVGSHLFHFPPDAEGSQSMQDTVFTP